MLNGAVRCAAIEDLDLVSMDVYLSWSFAVSFEFGGNLCYNGG